MFGPEQFARMKDGVRLVNTARGGIYQTEALVDALKSGKVASAAIDVFEVEPTTESPLFAFDNVIVTPHLGASTEEAQDRAGEQIAELVAAGLRGEMVSTAVNIAPVPPEVMERGRAVPAARRAGRARWSRSSRAAASRARGRHDRRARGHRHAHPAHGRAQGAARDRRPTSRSTTSTPTTSPNSAASTSSETRRPETHDYVSMIVVKAQSAAGEPVEVAAALIGKKNEPQARVAVRLRPRHAARHATWRSSATRTGRA